MINLNEHPEATAHLSSGDHVTIDGREFTVLEMQLMSVPSGIYLTEVSSRVDEYNRLVEHDDDISYHDFITHVRINNGDAVFDRTALMIALKERSYCIF